LCDLRLFSNNLQHIAFVHVARVSETILRPQAFVKCTICFEKIAIGGIDENALFAYVSVLGETCGHIFHVVCLSVVLANARRDIQNGHRSQLTCPTCRHGFVLRNFYRTDVVYFPYNHSKPRPLRRGRGAKNNCQVFSFLVNGKSYNAEYGSFPHLDLRKLKKEHRLAKCSVSGRETWNNLSAVKYAYSLQYSFANLNYEMRAGPVNNFLCYIDVHRQRRQWRELSTDTYVWSELAYPGISSTHFPEEIRFCNMHVMRDILMLWRKEWVEFETGQ
jgi:hypothetical protein